MLNSASVELEETNPDSPRLDAELLLSHVLECPRLDLFLNGDQPLNGDQLVAYLELLRQRSLACPVAYLTGEKEFWSLTLEVSKDTLIPRPDTEILVETAVEQILKWQKTNHGKTCCIAELGTGTAAIPLALCAELTNLHITSVDCSEQILAIAARNIHSYKNLLAPRNNQLDLVQSDLFPAIDTPVSAGDGKATEHTAPIFTAGKRNHISPEIALEVQAQKGQVGRVDRVVEMLVQGKKSATTGTVSQSAQTWTALR